MCNDMPSIKWLRLSWLMALMAMAYYLFIGLTLESNILKLLPKYESEKTNEVIDQVTKSINRKIILMAKTPKETAVHDYFLEQMKTLEHSGFFKEVLYQVDIEKAIEVYQLFYPYRFTLLNKKDQQSLQSSTENGPEMAVQLAKEQLFGLSAINGNQLQQDPLFLFQRYINQLSQLSAFDFDTSSGYFEVQIDQYNHLFAFLELNDSAYSPQVQQQVDGLLASLNPGHARTDHSLVTWSSFGTVRYASEAYQQAKHEISTVGLGSLIGITLLFIVAFRSLRPLLLSLAAIASGLVVALAMTSLVFGQVHVFALVFGATIAGVSIDYCFHYLIEFQNQPDQKVCLKTLSKPLLLGFSSSALVYLGFTITGYQVLAQISVFSVTGLLAVLLQVLLFFPLLINPTQSQAPTITVNLANAISVNPLAIYCANIYRLLALFFITLLLLFFVYKPNDDVRALQSLSPELKQQEAEIKQVLSWQSSDAYLLFQSESLDQVLTEESEALRTFRQQGHEVFGVSDLIPNKKHQLLNQSLLKTLYQSTEVQNYLIEFGLSNPFKQSTFPATEIISNEYLAKLISQRFMGQVGGMWTLVLPIESAYDQSDLPETPMIQQAEDTSALFATFRVKSTWMLAIAILVLLGALTLFRYTFKQALSVVLIPVVAGLLALLISQSLGYHVSLFSILGQLLVLGMGIDYVVFLKESTHPKVIMRALLLSACTTILAFGLLTLSEVAVINSFGFTVGIGIVLVLLMSPAVATRRNNDE